MTTTPLITPPLTPELYDRWIEALRSGKYEQGKNYLRKDNKYCCLGVLCDLYDLTEWIGNEFNGCEEFPPDHLLDLKISQSLSVLNDNRQFTFGKIADYLVINKERLLGENQDAFDKRRKSKGK